MVLSRKLKALRGSMSQSELARRAGVDKAIISKIEAGKMAGSVECHKRVAEALGLKLSQLYSYLEEDRPADVEYRSGQARSDVYADFMEILTVIPLSKKMLPTLISLKAGESCHLEESLKDAERFIYLLEGKVEISVDDSRNTLTRAPGSSKGDSLYSKSKSTHRIKNAGRQTAYLLCISSPPVL